jgi:Immunity protein 51
MMGTGPDQMNIFDVAGSSSLTFGCGDLPVDAAVLAAGHEPNGYFWEGAVQYLAAGLASQVELDCEAGMFCARGDRAVLGQLRDELQGYIDDPGRLAHLVSEAETSGFQFDD